MRNEIPHTACPCLQICYQQKIGKNNPKAAEMEADNAAVFLRCIHKECALWFHSAGRMVIWIYLLYFLFRL